MSSAWSGVFVILLVLIGVAIVLRRSAQLVPILINGYTPPAAGANGAAVSFAALDDLFARYPALTLVHIIPGCCLCCWGRCNSAAPCAGGICAGIAGSGASSCCAAQWLACLGAGDELWDAGDWRRESSRRDDAICHVLFVRAGQCVSAYSAARGCAASRVDDSGLRDWSGGRHDPADHRHIFCHQPCFRPDAG